MRITLLILIWLLPQILSSQFVTQGTAIVLDSVQNCFRLVHETEGSASGAVWSTNKINLAESWDYTFHVTVGCADSMGADGIAVVFHNSISGLTAIGEAGAGLGFQGINPSVAIEVDTWNNTPLTNDPREDHISVIYNSQMRGALAFGPVPALPNGRNIEDCSCHSLRIQWNGNTTTLKVWWDDILRVDFKDDIVENIFNGENIVYWGITAGTGGARNTHSVCFEPTIVKDTISCNEAIAMSAESGWAKYQWTPNIGLSCDTCRVTTVTENIPNTTYVVTAEDVLGCRRTLGEYVLSTEVPPLEIISSGDNLCLQDTIQLRASENYKYFRWNTGDTTDYLFVTEEGEYILTAWNHPICSTVARYTVRRQPLPTLIFAVPEKVIYLQTEKIPEERCVQIPITNNGSSLITLQPENLWFRNNVYFSLPLSQFPISIDGGGTRNVSVCFYRDGFSSHEDFLRVETYCSLDSIQFVAPQIPLQLSGNSRCDVKVIANGVEQKFRLQVAPIPINDEINVTISAYEEKEHFFTSSIELKFVLYDIFGRKIHSISKEIHAMQGFILDSHHLPSGTYILVVENAQTPTHIVIYKL